MILRIHHADPDTRDWYRAIFDDCVRRCGDMKLPEKVELHFKAAIPGAYGLCWPGPVPRIEMPLYTPDKERAENTFRHELAHAFLPAGAGHGDDWLKMAKRLDYSWDKLIVYEWAAMEGETL